MTMNQGTPEEIQEVRHRRKVWITISIVCLCAFLLVSRITLLIFSQGTALAIIIIGGLFGVVTMIVFSLMYWRCPRCKEYFPKGSDGRYCENCNTKFDA
jgi:Flp pilus assembly protein TadB